MKKLFLIAWRSSRADLRFLWFALRHPLRPRWLRLATVALIVFAISPVNFVIPLVGVIDDMIVIPLVLHWLLSCLPEDLHRSYHRGAPLANVHEKI